MDNLEPLYSITEATRKLSANPLLLRRLIDHHQIPFRIVGRAIVLDEAGLAQLRQALKAWNSRLRIRDGQAKKTRPVHSG